MHDNSVLFMDDTSGTVKDLGSNLAQIVQMDTGNPADQRLAAKILVIRGIEGKGTMRRCKASRKHRNICTITQKGFRLYMAMFEKYSLH